MFRRSPGHLCFVFDGFLGLSFWFCLWFCLRLLGFGFLVLVLFFGFWFLGFAVLGLWVFGFSVFYLFSLARALRWRGMIRGVFHAGLYSPPFI